VILGRKDLQAMDDNEERDQLEERIIEASNLIDNMQPDWCNSKEWDLFIESWYQLAKYYETHTDSVIGIEVVREYSNFVRLLRKLLCDEKLDLEIRKQVEEKIIELEGRMDEIIKEAVTNKYN
jgi:hypothetical protein